MDFCLFKDFIKHVAGDRYPKNINFDLGGEPFLNPRLIDMVDFAALNGKLTSITTNGTLLSKGMIGGLLKSRLHQISISVDIVNGVNIRDGYPFKIIAGNINNLIEERKHSKKRQPKVIIRCINFEGSSRKTILRQLKAKPDGIIFCPVTNWAGLVGEELPHEKRHVCLLPWIEMAMLYNGDFALCCNDPRGDLVIGNFPENNLEDIWNGRALIELREIISGKKIASLKGQNCQRCSRMRKGISLKEFIDYYRGKTRGGL